MVFVLLCTSHADNDSVFISVFMTASTLKSHLKTHSSDSSRKCSYCSRLHSYAFRAELFTLVLHALNANAKLNRVLQYWFR